MEGRSQREIDVAGRSQPLTLDVLTVVVFSRCVLAGRSVVVAVIVVRMRTFVGRMFTRDRGKCVRRGKMNCMRTASHDGMAHDADNCKYGDNSIHANL